MLQSPLESSVPFYKVYSVWLSRGKLYIYILLVTISGIKFCHRENPVQQNAGTGLGPLGSVDTGSDCVTSGCSLGFSRPLVSVS